MGRAGKVCLLRVSSETSEELEGTPGLEDVKATLVRGGSGNARRVILFGLSPQPPPRPTLDLLFKQPLAEFWISSFLEVDSSRAGAVLGRTLMHEVGMGLFSLEREARVCATSAMDGFLT